uniref:DUF2470 domain-containing protein n=1 Tax=Mesocestoides corti TaxID=53468 RepID=A0A5K3FUP9_MESCO
MHQLRSRLARAQRHSTFASTRTHTCPHRHPTLPRLCLFRRVTPTSPALTSNAFHTSRTRRTAPSRPHPTTSGVRVESNDPCVHASVVAHMSHAHANVLRHQICTAS